MELYPGFAVSSSGSRGVFQGFWRMLFYGSTLLIRLVNVHVLIGVLSTYGVMEFSLRILMQVFFGDLRSSEAGKIKRTTSGKGF